MNTPSNIKPAIRIRIIVIDPPVGVTFGVQRGASGVVDQKQSLGGNLTFEFPVNVADAVSAPVRFTGEFVQGPASARFVYINSGTLSGQVTSWWTRRAKVPLSAVPKELVAEALTNGQVLVAEIFGKGIRHRNSRPVARKRCPIQARKSSPTRSRHVE